MRNLDLSRCSTSTGPISIIKRSYEDFRSIELSIFDAFFRFLGSRALQTAPEKSSDKSSFFLYQTNADSNQLVTSSVQLLTPPGG